jgi:hypothetical protein
MFIRLVKSSERRRFYEFFPYGSPPADNFVEDVMGNFQCEVNKPYLLYRNKNSEVRALLLSPFFLPFSFLYWSGDAVFGEVNKPYLLYCNKNPEVRGALLFCPFSVFLYFPTWVRISVEVNKLYLFYRNKNSEVRAPLS